MTDFNDDDIEFAPDHDPVHSPSHYTSGGIECIDALEAALTPEEARGFRKGNAIKYIWRAGLKGDYIEDLEKAKWYLNREITAEEKRRIKPGALTAAGCFCGPDEPCDQPELHIDLTASVGSSDETESDRPHPRIDVGALPDARSEQLVRDSHQQLGFLS